MITYDKPDDPYWMNPDNVKLCLESYCPNTKFNVEWADFTVKIDPWKREMKKDRADRRPKAYASRPLCK
jgi:RNA polymerase subunit RPABC4/transcription elongation factor Spt4